MRILAACLTAVLGLSGLVTMGACSDVSTDASGGAGGAATTAGAGGASAGSSSTAGTGGAACMFTTSVCQTCIQTKCGEFVLACSNDSVCKPGIATLSKCACDGTSTTDECAAAFLTSGGTPAEKLTNCYSTSCADVCQPPAP